MVVRIWIISLFSIFFLESDSVSEQEVIYARRDGMALTMTILKPEKPNGKAVISLISSGYYSSYSFYPNFRKRAQLFLDAGYTVFLTQHCSAPRYTIPDALQDVQTAVQFIRLNAAVYGINPDKIGITGSSSGGHLALLAAVTDDVKDAASENPLDRMSSRVKAVAVFCPPTDFLNYGKDHNPIRKQEAVLKDIQVENSFRYTQFDKQANQYIPLQEPELTKTDSMMSPAQLVTSDDPPVLIYHGTKDDIVPFQQAQIMTAQLKGKGIPVLLLQKEGAGHGWTNMNDDVKEFIKWFDRYL